MSGRYETRSVHSPVLLATLPRAREGLGFHGRFYGLRNFCCKTVQLWDARCKPDLLGAPLKNTLCNATKNCAIR
jgi:hypothetical protein